MEVRSKRTPGRAEKLMGKPNIILAQSSGHRGDCTGYAGNAEIHTPNLDALAAHGVNFARATSPWVEPADGQAAVLTGRERLSGRGDTLPSLLRGAGYHTGLCGRVAADLSRLRDDFAAADDCVPAEREEEHSTACVGNAAVRFIQHAQEPFFLCMFFDKPRPPFDPPEPWSRLYKGEELTPLPDWNDTRDALALYYGLISQMDKQLGRVLATLASRAFTNNFIVYCSGSGWNKSERVPLLLAGQHRAQVNDAPASIADVAPSILNMAGVDVQDFGGTSLITSS